MIVTSKYWKNFISSGEGTLNLTPEDTDDIWTLYNLISVGDEVESVTMRKVLQESSSGEVVDSQKIKMILSVKVEKVDIDLAGASLRVNGKNVKECKHVKLGSYHTIDVEPERWLKLTKVEWDALSVELLEQAINSVGKVEIGAILMQEGLALICTVTPAGIKVLKRIEVAMPKKKLGPTSQTEKSLDRFFGETIAAAMECVKFASLKAIILASVEAGTKDEFYRRLLEKAQAEDNRAILDNKNKFMRIGITTVAPSALELVLKEPRIASLLADTKSANEQRLMDSYHKMANVDPDRTTFGPKHVSEAAEQCAVKSLLLSDSLFRSLQVSERKFYAKLVEIVKENGGEVMIYSSGSKPEEELAKLSGIAAILNFPVSFDE